MERRRFLVASAGIVGLSGCTDDQGFSDETPAQSTDTPDQGPDPQQAQQRLEAASTEFQDGWDEFDEEIESFDSIDTRVSFRSEVIEEHFNQVEDELDQAEPLANAEQQTIIEAFRNLLEWSRPTVSTFDIFADAVDSSLTAQTYFDNERYEDSANAFSESAGLLDDANEELTVAENRYEDIDFDAFDDYDEIAGLELEFAMEQMGSLITGFDYYARGMQHVALGMGSFQSAAEEFDNENFAEASDGFAEARNEFATGNNIITEGEESAPDEMIDHFIGLSCYTGAVRDAADHFKSASDAAQNGNWEQANGDVDNAETAIERCDFQA